jgi:hypothetical protein
MKKIAVIGAGIFGSTTAIKLAESGYAVDLYEREREVLQEASGINQFRLHRGYHYPRSKATALSSKDSEESFRTEYAGAIIDSVMHHYAIAREKSKITAAEFIQFCDECGLEYEETDLPYLTRETVEAIFKVRESLIDPIKLRNIVTQRLMNTSVRTLFNTEFKEADSDQYEYVVNCTYANLNAVFAGSPGSQKEYQFELCEKPILQLPSIFKNQSLVVMDGPFTCIDPFSDTGYHVMGNVVHAIHATNVGHFPIVPSAYEQLLNTGVVENPAITNIDKFIEAAAFFMPEIREAKHIGSMYTIRTVLPNVDRTDERPTLVYPATAKVINVFSGKIGNSVKAAAEVLRYLRSVEIP